MAPEARPKNPSYAERIDRARELARRYPQAAEALAFYADLAASQQLLAETHEGVIRSAATFAESLDVEAAADAMPELLSSVSRVAPPRLADAATEMLKESHADWRHLAHTYWRGTRSGDPLRSFLAEALLQPFAERVASGLRPDAPASGPPSGAPESGGAASCPICGDRPVVALLREEAHGARRSLLCGFCLSEWAAARLLCLSCGEIRFDALPVYRAEEFPAARVDACDTCHTYVKTIDLTRDGTAVPNVDDIATLALDVWARERGYTRLRAGLLRM